MLQHVDHELSISNTIWCYFSEAELGDGQMDEPVFIAVQAMPLNQHIERGHRKGQASFEVCPDPMAHLLQVAAR